MEFLVVSSEALAARDTAEAPAWSLVVNTALHGKDSSECFSHRWVLFVYLFVSRLPDEHVTCIFSFLVSQFLLIFHIKEPNLPLGEDMPLSLFLTVNSQHLVFPLPFLRQGLMWLRLILNLLVTKAGLELMILLLLYLWSLINKYYLLNLYNIMCMYILLGWIIWYQIINLLCYSLRKTILLKSDI